METVSGSTDEYDPLNPNYWGEHGISGMTIEEYHGMISDFGFSGPGYDASTGFFIDGYGNVYSDQEACADAVMSYAMQLFISGGVATGTFLGNVLPGAGTVVGALSGLIAGAAGGYLYGTWEQEEVCGIPNS